MPRFYGTATFPPKEQPRKAPSLRTRMFRSLHEDSLDEDAISPSHATDSSTLNIKPPPDRRHSEGLFEEDEETCRQQALSRQRSSLPVALQSEDASRLQRWFSDNLRDGAESTSEVSLRDAEASPGARVRSTLKRWFSLTGHEHPYSIKMSFLRDALGSADDVAGALELEEPEAAAAAQLQFILRPTKKAPTKLSLGTCTLRIRTTVSKKILLVLRNSSVRLSNFLFCVCSVLCRFKKRKNSTVFPVTALWEVRTQNALTVKLIYWLNY